VLLTVTSLQGDVIESMFQCLQHAQQRVVGAGQAARTYTHTGTGLDTCTRRHVYRVMELT